MKRLLIISFTIVLSQAVIAQNDARSICISELPSDEYSPEEYSGLINECIQEIEAFEKSQSDAGLIEDEVDSVDDVLIESPESNNLD